MTNDRVSDSLLQTLLSQSQENIESGVATDMLSLCPLTLRRLCNEIIERRVEFREYSLAAGEQYSKLSREKDAEIERLSGALQWIKTEVEDEDAVMVAARALQGLSPLPSDEPRAVQSPAWSVRIPAGEDEAVAMTILGTEWLKLHAPHRLRNELKSEGSHD